MRKLFCTELLKSKRTLLRLVLFIGPAIFGLLLAIVANLAPDTLKNSWEHYTKMIFNMWTLAFNTLGISLISVLIEHVEKKNGTYRAIYIESQSTTTIWIAKILSLSFYSFIATGLLTAFVTGLAVANHLSTKVIVSVLELGAITWVMSLAVIPVVLFCAHYFGMIGALAIGFIGFISAPIMAPENYWILNPYSYAIRSIVPITKIHPNGIILESTSSLLNGNIIVFALCTALGWLIVSTIITSFIFSKKEVG